MFAVDGEIRHLQDKAMMVDAKPNVKLGKFYTSQKSPLLITAGNSTTQRIILFTR